MAVDVVWFKKDLRTYDHSPLIEAANSDNTTLCLFALEPKRFELDDVDPIHVEWELKNAVELSKSLEKIGGSLHFEINDIVTILNKINLKSIKTHSNIFLSKVISKSSRTHR